MNVLSPIRKGDEAERLAPLGQEPRRLWSLWDMYELKATDFLQAVSTLELIRVAVDGSPEEETAMPLKPSMVRSMDNYLAKLKKSVDALQCVVCSKAIERLLVQVKESPPITYAGLARSSGEIHQRLHDELGATKLLHLNSEEISYYEASNCFFGVDVLVAFTALEYDITETAKCLALGRSTASAFHAIRCLEGAIRAISRSLGIADPTKGADRSWAKQLAPIKAEIDRRWPPNSAARMSGEGQFFEETYALLTGVQNPYRNATMHLDHKYTPEEAREISNLVGAFMKKVACRMDEHGEPKA